MDRPGSTLLKVTGILVIIMGAFFALVGVASFFGGGLLSFFASSFGLKTAFGGIIKFALGAFAIYTGVKGIKLANNPSQNNYALLCGAVLAAVLLIALIVGLFSHSANIFTVSNFIVAGLFAFGAFKVTP